MSEERHLRDFEHLARAVRALVGSPDPSESAYLVAAVASDGHVHWGGDAPSAALRREMLEMKPVSRLVLGEVDIEAVRRAIPGGVLKCFQLVVTTRGFLGKLTFDGPASPAEIKRISQRMNEMRSQYRDMVKREGDAAAEQQYLAEGRELIEAAGYAIEEYCGRWNAERDGGPGRRVVMMGAPSLEAVIRELRAPVCQEAMEALGLSNEDFGGLTHEEKVEKVRAAFEDGCSVAHAPRG